VTDLREVFGQAEIDQKIRLAMKGQPTFWACEAGIEFGTRSDKVEVPIVDGRGIFFAVDMPNGVALDEWLGKVNKAMDQVKARLKAAAKQQDSAAHAGRPI